MRRLCGFVREAERDREREVKSEESKSWKKRRHDEKPFEEESAEGER